MSSFLQGILADPATGEALELVNGNHFLNKQNGNSYPVQQGLPNFLTGSAVHAATHHPQSTFDYRDHYEKDAALVDYFQEDEALVTRNERKRNRQAIINAISDNDKTILDIGCGGAWVAEHFLSRGRNVISMDISSINPAKAKEKYPQENHAAIIADALQLPFKDESIDCIIASEVIEHIPDPAVFLKNVLAKIKPGGKLVLMTPYNEKIRYHLCIHCNRPTPQNGHLHSFTEAKILSLVPGTVSDKKATAFCNNYLLKLRLYNLLAFLPFSIWKIIDSMANLVARKPLSLLTVITKK